MSVTNNPPHQRTKLCRPSNVHDRVSYLEEVERTLRKGLLRLLVDMYTVPRCV